MARQTEMITLLLEQLICDPYQTKPSDTRDTIFEAINAHENELLQLSRGCHHHLPRRDLHPTFVDDYRERWADRRAPHGSLIGDRCDASLVLHGYT